MPTLRCTKVDIQTNLFTPGKDYPATASTERYTRLVAIRDDLGHLRYLTSPELRFVIGEHGRYGPAAFAWFDPAV